MPGVTVVSIGGTTALDAVAAGRAFQVSLLSADFSDTSRRLEP